MLILGWDTETTGLDTRKDYILELGCAIYDTDSKQIFNPQSFLLQWPDKPVITEKITQLTGLTQSMIDQHGIYPDTAILRFFQMAAQCEYLVGHNSLFYDREILETALLRMVGSNSTSLSESLKKELYSFKHIDTTCDAPYPDHITVRKLNYLCFEHGIIMNNAHRAIADVFGCLGLVAKYDFKEILASAQTPLLTIEADVSYEERELASSVGFYWKVKEKRANHFEKKGQWLKKIRQLKYHPKNYNFPTSIVSSLGGADLLSDPLYTQHHQPIPASNNAGSDKQLPLSL